MKLKMPIRKVFLFIAILAIVLTIGAFAANMLVQRDRVDYPFENDPSLVGTWEPVDFVKEKSNFVPGIQSWPLDKNDSFVVKRIAFTSEGKSLISVKGEPLTPGGFTFTKDHILHLGDKTDSAYEIRDIDGAQYLLMQWKSGDYTFRHQVPYYYVFKKLDSDDHINDEFISLQSDDTDLTFVSDENLLGQWHSVSFVKTIDKFTPQKPDNGISLFLKSATFYEDGNVSCVTTQDGGDEEERSGYFTWTKGKLITVEHSCVRDYHIKEIQGKTYLFFPWINGDVIYRNDPVHYYVFEKTE